MNSPLSSTPFGPAELRRHNSTALARRVFTRSPFAGASPLAAPAPEQTHPRGRVTLLPLPRRDRSLYAWFESGGMLLTLGAIAAAVAAILVG